MVIQTRLRRWGNSIGVVIPMNTLKNKNLKEGEEVVVEITKKDKMKEIFGSLRDWKIDTQKLKKELRKDWAK